MLSVRTSFKAHLLLPPAAAILACAAAFAQGVQNQDIYLMAGLAHSGSRQVPGTNVTLYSHTAFASSTGYGYQLARASAASIWLDLSIGTFVLGSSGKASIPGPVSRSLQAYAAAARFVFPLQSRVSAHAVAGGGGGGFAYNPIEGGANPYLGFQSTCHGVVLTGAGIDIRLTERFSVRGELRDLVTGKGLSGSAGRNHLLPLFGVAAHF